MYIYGQAFTTITTPSRNGCCTILDTQNNIMEVYDDKYCCSSYSPTNYSRVGDSNGASSS